MEVIEPRHRFNCENIGIRPVGNFCKEDRMPSFRIPPCEASKVPIKEVHIFRFRKKRIWRKKVSYDCRKKVADGRLRIKGKFVTREQACEQLGLESLDNYSA